MAMHELEEYDVKMMKEIQEIEELNKFNNEIETTHHYNGEKGLDDAFVFGDSTANLNIHDSTNYLNFNKSIQKLSFNLGQSNENILSEAPEDNIENENRSILNYLILFF
jgi:hypothetical protein